MKTENEIREMLREYETQMNRAHDLHHLYIADAADAVAEDARKQFLSDAEDQRIIMDRAAQTVDILSRILA